MPTSILGRGEGRDEMRRGREVRKEEEEGREEEGREEQKSIEMGG